MELGFLIGLFKIEESVVFGWISPFIGKKDEFRNKLFCIVVFMKIINL